MVSDTFSIDVNFVYTNADNSVKLFYAIDTLFNAYEIRIDETRREVVPGFKAASQIAIHFHKCSFSKIRADKHKELHRVNMEIQEFSFPTKEEFLKKYAGIISENMTFDFDSIEKAGNPEIRYAIFRRLKNGIPHHGMYVTVHGDFMKPKDGPYVIPLRGIRWHKCDFVEEHECLMTTIDGAKAFELLQNISSFYNIPKNELYISKLTLSNDIVTEKIIKSGSDIDD